MRLFTWWVSRWCLGSPEEALSPWGMLVPKLSPNKAFIVTELNLRCPLNTSSCLTGMPVNCKRNLYSRKSFFIVMFPQWWGMLQGMHCSQVCWLYRHQCTYLHLDGTVTQTSRWWYVISTRHLRLLPSVHWTLLSRNLLLSRGLLA